MIRKIIGVTVGTTLNPKKIAGNAEHSHSWNDLLDKPFYETGEEVISWEKPTEDMIKVSETNKETGEEQWSFPNGYYYVSDKIPTVDEFKNGVITLSESYEGDASVSEISIADMLDADWLVLTEKVYGCPMAVLIVTEDNLEFDNADDIMVFPKAGMYFFNEYTDENNYTSIQSLKLPGGVKKLDEKFVPKHEHSWNDLTDKPFYEGGSSGGEFAFDGVADGKECVEIKDVDTGETEAYLVKISDETIEPEQLLNQTIIIVTPEGEIEEVFTEEGLEESIYEISTELYVVSALFYIARENTEFD